MKIKRQSKTDWQRIDALRDEDIDTSDIPAITAEQLKTARVRGQPPLTDERFRRENFVCRLPRWLLEWIQAQPDSAGRQTEEAFKRAYKLKAPK